MAVPSLPQELRSSKAQWRAAALDRRRAYARSLTPEARRVLERALAQRVLPHLLGARVVAAYHPLIDEISPYPTIDLLDGGQTVVLPWFAGRDSSMIFRKAPATEPGLWDILQPPADAEALAPDLLLVPLLAADRLGNRLGYGKGYYDRAIAQLKGSGDRISTIGLAWEGQISGEPLGAEPFDMPLDAIATPAEWIDCLANRASAETTARPA